MHNTKTTGSTKYIQNQGHNEILLIIMNKYTTTVQNFIQCLAHHFQHTCTHPCTHTYTHKTILTVSHNHTYSHTHTHIDLIKQKSSACVICLPISYICLTPSCMALREPKKLSVWIRESVWFDTDNSINNNINPDFK